ncbi:KAT8 regulatory NSL complex subunit 1-like protein isoform X2 [Phyllopteryx taeniolatus]|uniref:KAT8 regulatory NSL complex subunit 1-like protein isoform X2 n=1 Tax=Phyllopteryx taeniolatus TaxID=161469 RepID=UPI002AD511CC|nr:KAT8 regulatory NSL complex subunit 1-like protein isoform X2 [Phyllopteryx taeniolatus]
MQSAEVEFQMRSTEGGDFQKMWLDLSSLSPLEAPVSPLWSPIAFGGQRSLQGSNELIDAPRMSSILPGVPDIAIVSDYNSQGACHLNASACVPDGVDHSSLIIVSPPDSQVKADQSSPALGSGQGIWKIVLENAVKESQSRHAALNIRARRLKRSAQTLLAEITSLHCSQHLEGLRKLCVLDSKDPGKLASRALLRHLQQDLDSEATASSSSDEAQDEVRSHRGAKTICSSCEHKWLEERAEIGSRWIWLQLRLADLEGKLEQLGELHKNIRSNKIGVVLAESQPPTDRQIQQTLLKEMAGLSCSTLDADMEPCSPNRLLYNIERQSAQLSQIVNTLMLPLGFSAPSKQQVWNSGRDISSGARGDVFMPWGSNRRLRKLYKSDVSCVCARTRPLVTHRKPKLFFFDSYNASPRDLLKSTAPLLCSCHSSCDPVVQCSDPDCSSSSRTFTSLRTPSVLPPSCESPQRSLGRERWFQKHLVIDVRPPSPSHYNRCRPTLYNTPVCLRGHRHMRQAGPGMHLSSIKLADSTPHQRRRSNQQKRKTKHTFIKDEMSEAYHLLDPEEIFDESFKKGFVCQHSNRKVNMPVSKVEKMLSKHILTPSWHVVDIQCLVKETERDTEEGQVEVLTDAVFAQRHLALELKEKLYSKPCGRRTCRRHPTRPGSRSRGSVGVACKSRLESSVEWSHSQLKPDEQLSLEQRLPHWELRTFPLDKNEEKALLDDNVETLRPLADNTCA